MRFDRMDRRLELFAYGSTVDAYGQRNPELDAAAYATPWAEVVYAGKAGEKLTAHQLYSTADVVFIIRHPRGSYDIKATDVVKYGGAIWAVQGTEEIGRLEGLKVYTKRQEDA